MAEWNSDVEKDATFMPQTIDTSNEEDYNVWKTESRGWRKLEAALRGGSALNTEAGEAHAATLVDPQTLVDSAVTFHQIRDALVWLENFIRDQVQAVAGPDRAWQGAAADAFLTKMDLLAEHVGRNAERINGGEAYGPNSVPEALYRSAHYLRWGQEQVYHLDVSYAEIARMDGVGDGGDGPVPISGSKFEKPMAEQMAQVVGTVATEYHSTYSQVQPPTEGTVPIPSLTLGDHTTPPSITITTPPPLSTPPLLSVTPPPSLNVTTPPPLNVTAPPPSSGPPLVTQPPFAPPSIAPPSGGPGLTVPTFNAAGTGDGPGLGPGITPPTGAANFQPPGIGAPPGGGGGLPGLGGGNGPAPIGGNGAFVPPVIGNVPGFDGGPKAGANTVKPPAVGGPPNAGAAGGGAGGADFKPPALASPPGGAGPGLGSGIPGTGGIDLPEIAPPPAGAGLGGGAGGGAGGGMPPMMPGSPGAGGGSPGGGGGGIPDPSDAGGLLGGDADDWTSPAIGAVDAPNAPWGASPGGGGLGGQSPMMPGMPGSGGGAPGAGGGIPDASDASGLVSGDEADWQSPVIGAVDAPDAPLGAAPGGGGLGGQSPMMPGMPGSGGGAPGAGGGIPDASDASGLVSGDEADWQSPVIGAVDAPDAPLGAAPGGGGLGQPPMMPGMPGSGGGPGSAGSGSVEAPDAQGLVTGDVSSWRPSGADYEVPGSPSGAEAGGGGLTVPGYEPPSGTGLASDVEGPAAEGADETVPQQTAGGGVPLAGQPPMMPGAGQPGAGQPGAGAGIPDAPDAQGLVDADLVDWQPAGGDLGDPSAPQGTAAGGAGLEVPQWEQSGDLPSATDSAFAAADDVTLPEYGGTESSSDTPAGMPAMPGLSGGTAPPGALSPADGTIASELIDADTVDWQPAEAGTIPFAPNGAAAGGGGLQTSIDVPPPAIPVESVVSLPGTDGSVVDWPATDGPPAQWPATDGPATDGPTAEWPVVDGPAANGPATDGPATNAPVVTEPVAADPGVTEPVTANPGVVEAPAVTDPAMPEPVQTDPVAADPVQGDPVQGDPVQGDPVQAEPVQAEPVAADPVVAVPAPEPFLPAELVPGDGTGLQTPPDAADAVPVERPAVQQMAVTVANAAPANPNGSAAPTGPGEDDAAAQSFPAVVFPVPQPVVPAPPSAASAPAVLGRDAVAAGTLPHDPRLAAAIPGRPQPEDDREAPERPESAELLHDGTGAWDAAGPVDGTPAGDDFVPVITVDDDDMSGWDDVDGAAWLTGASPHG
ncbi:hypothetical protein [Actinoplanes auranticolor]|uniref:hypothetical protein n=1 Tax=Actinoplanes auranticolor TaxID=47988 RepID=UPI0031EFF0A8